MKTTRHFLGWDGSVVDKVRDFLLAEVTARAGQPVDLGELLIVVPTRQAGRRLREAMARWCSTNETSLLSAQVVTPKFLFTHEIPEATVAGVLLARSVWVQLLTNADLSSLEALFPRVQDDRTFQWALNTGLIVERLRQELADGALTIQGVLDSHAGDLEELERWQNLAELEQRYLAELEKTGKIDGCLDKIAKARAPQVDAGVKKIIVAAVPDPSLLAVEAFCSLAQERSVEILVHAPPELTSDFDQWGRPKPGAWRHKQIEIPDWEDCVALEATPVDQARRVIQEVAAQAHAFESGEIAIGVPDRSVIPFLDKLLSAEGMPPFDPEDAIVGEHPVGLLTARVTSLLQTHSYEALAEFLRHADVLAFLEQQHELKSLTVLEQLDRFQNYYLPVSWGDMLRPFAGNPKGTREPRDDFTDLGKALTAVRSLRETLTSGGFEDAWRAFYCTVYGGRMLEPDSVRDSEFESAVAALDGVVREFRDMEDAGHAFDLVDLSTLFVSRLKETRYHRERRDEIVDLEGWQELAWNDRPLLMVTGMNERFVPGGSLSDAFLPDSLRNVLGLRDDAARFARDLFLMQGMIASRRQRAGVRWVVGKTTTSGDPLKPSRLLFRCDDAELPSRVERLLAKVTDTRARPYADVVMRLEPGAADKTKDIQADRYLSVTSIKDYLTCPFRFFYLKHVVGMEELSDDKVGLDSRDFGIIVHHILETMGKHEALWSMTDADALAKELAALADEYVAGRFGGTHPLSVEVSLLSAKERLRACAREQVSLVNEGWVVNLVEAGEGQTGKAKERWQLKRKGFTISGRIDRIDENMRDGRIRIMDYKTFDNPIDPETAHLVRRSDDTPDYNELKVIKELRSGTKVACKRWADLQLPLYAMIYTQKTQMPGDLELGYFSLPKATSHTGVHLWRRFDNETLASAARCLDGVLDALANGTFWPPAERVAYDDFERLFLFEPERVFNPEGL